MSLNFKLEFHCFTGEYFVNEYKAAPDRARLALSLAKTENKALNEMYQDGVSLYIGIPFCPTRCLYCSFAANPIAGCKSLVELYLESLYKEIKAISSYIDEKQLYVESVYFGEYKYTGKTYSVIIDTFYFFIIQY